MTCQECELALAGEERGEERSPVVDQHVQSHMAGCAACREFAMELRENSEALRAFAMESMPALPQVPFNASPHRQQVAWWVGVAAVLVLGFVSSWMLTGSSMGRSQRIPVVTAPRQIASISSGGPPQPNAVRDRPAAEFRPSAAAIPHRGPSRSQQKDEPHILQVKMLTDDPDVVIYWQIEN
jgi:hypothetical protein